MLVRLGIASQRRRPITGVSGMIGEPGRVIEAIAPGRPGRVETHGEIWRASADEAIGDGAGCA